MRALYYDMSWCSGKNDVVTIKADDSLDMIEEADNAAGESQYYFQSLPLSSLFCLSKWASECQPVVASMAWMS